VCEPDGVWTAQEQTASGAYEYLGRDDSRFGGRTAVLGEVAIVAGFPRIITPKRSDLPARRALLLHRERMVRLRSGKDGMRFIGGYLAAPAPLGHLDRLIHERPDPSSRRLG
jgi:hypothetical protein